MKETLWWTLQLLTGLLLIVLMALHMGLMHMDTLFGIGDQVAWKEVAVRAKEVMYLVTYILVLGAALFHGLYGLRNIVFELSLPKPVEVLVSICVSAAGFGFFIFGTYTVVKTFGA